MIITSLQTSATLLFNITGALPPIQISQIRWIYSTLFSYPPSNSSVVDITNLTKSSRYSFSNDLLSLTISNITPSDMGRYFLTATTDAGSGLNYIDVIVEGT